MAYKQTFLFESWYLMCDVLRHMDLLAAPLNLCTEVRLSLAEHLSSLQVEQGTITHLQAKRLNSL